MTTAAEAVLAHQRAMESKVVVTLPAGNNPVVTQIAANLLKLDERGLKLTAAMVATLVRFNEPAK